MAQFKHKKKFGQNFLHDQNLISEIVAEFEHYATSGNVVEIGPGLGALTTELSALYPTLRAIEVDSHACEILQQKFPTLSLINQDVLQVDFTTLGENLNIIGNLPYNIATQIILNLIALPNIDCLLFMVQAEVAERITALPNSKDYGRLSIITQAYCKVNKLMSIPPHVFKPPPKVDSAIIVLQPYHDNRFNCDNFAALEEIVKAAFAQRRKTIYNNLKSFFSQDELRAMDVNPQHRAEQLTLAQYILLANHFNGK